MNGDLRTRFAIYHTVGLLADAARGLGEQVLREITNVDWPGLFSMRAILVHQPWLVKSEIVWDAVTVSIPSLLNEIRQYMDRVGDVGESSH